MLILIASIIISIMAVAASDAVLAGFTGNIPASVRIHVARAFRLFSKQFTKKEPENAIENTIIMSVAAGRRVPYPTVLAGTGDRFRRHGRIAIFTNQIRRSVSNPSYNHHYRGTARFILLPAALPVSGG